MSVDLVPSTGRWTFPAGQTSLTQFTFVTLNGSGQLVVPAAGAQCVVLDDAPALAPGGAPGPYVVGVSYGVVFEGVIRVKLGAGGITALAPVTTDNAGLAVAAGSGNVINGVAMAAGNAGDLCSIKVSLAGAIHA